MSSTGLQISLEATFSFFIGFGSFITVVNTPMLIFIYSNRKLRKQKEVIIIGFICLADLSNAVAFLFAGIHRLSMVNSGNAALYWYSTECAKAPFAYLFIASYQLVGVSTLCITLDRVIAVLYPFAYRTFTWRYAYTLLGGCLMFVVIGTTTCVVAWHTGPVYWVPAMCYTSTAYIPAVWNYMLYFRQASIATSIILYLPIAIRVFLLQRASKLRSKMYQGVNPHRKLVKTTFLIGITLLCEILFVAIPDSFLNFNLFGLKKYEMIWYLVVLSKGIVNIFLYSFNHDDIKAVLLSHLPSSFRAHLSRRFQIRHISFASATYNNSRRFRTVDGHSITDLPPSDGYCSQRRDQRATRLQSLPGPSIPVSVVAPFERE